jgi:sensor histidine kinase regulating citrate/malate metabolism
MFAQIETNGATHIIIHVPHVGAERSLPALAAMLEQNAIFLQNGYSDRKIVEPKMSVMLGDRVDMDMRDDSVVIKVPDSGAVLDDSFVIAQPQVFVSNAKAIKERDERYQRINTELSFVKSELARYKEMVEKLTTQTHESLG